MPDDVKPDTLLLPDELLPIVELPQEKEMYETQKSVMNRKSHYS